MATQKFTGVIPPVVVPDTEDHQLDVASFERSINRMIDAGVDGLFFLGSSGEVVFSTDERRRQIIAEAVRIVDHRVPVMVGIIDTETERMISDKVSNGHIAHGCRERTQGPVCRIQRS